jgi:hypothetical protein
MAPIDRRLRFSLDASIFGLSGLCNVSHFKTLEVKLSE